MPTPTTPAHASTQEERVAIHCDATSFDATRAEPLRIAAIRLRGHRILTGSALILHAEEDGFPADAGARLAAFLGDRPLIGYFLDFSATLAERLIGAPLPNERIEVSGLYYDRKIKTALKHAVDLRLDRMIADLDLPVRADDAQGTALAAAMAWLRLTGRG